jgi:hypothetical protein
MVTDVLAQDDTPQLFVHSAKYVVLDAGAAIVSEEPDPTYEPPHDPEYQFRVVPLPPAAVSVIFGKTPWQKLEWSTIADAGATGNGLIMTVVLAQVEAPQDVDHEA